MNDTLRRITGTPRRAVVVLGIVIIGVMAIAGAAPVHGQENGPGEWATLYCSADAVRSRHSSRLMPAPLSPAPPDGTRARTRWSIQQIITVGYLERECFAAAAEGAINPPQNRDNLLSNAFCSERAVQGRHPADDPTLLLRLRAECYGTVQAASNAASAALALSLQRSVAAAYRQARELVRCEEVAGGHTCTHPDDPYPPNGCDENAPDGSYLLIPRLGYAGLLPSWEDADQEELLTYQQCSKDSDRYKVVNFIGVTVCNSIPRETHREPARVRPSVPWSP